MKNEPEQDSDDDLFAPRARRSDPETSHAAARSVRGDAVKQTDEGILEILSRRPGGEIVAEIAREMGRPVISVSPRPAILQRMGRIHNSGEKRRNPETGRHQIVWKIGPDQLEFSADRCARPVAPSRKEVDRMLEEMVRALESCPIDALRLRSLVNKYRSWKPKAGIVSG